METFELSRAQRQAGATLVALISALSLAACATSSPTLITESPAASQSVTQTPSATTGISNTEAPVTPGSSEPVESATPSNDAGEMVNADNAYDVCLNLFESSDLFREPTPDRYSREKLSPESESVIYERQDGIFGVGIYGTVGDIWNPDQRDFLITCYIEGSANDPTWYEFGSRMPVDPSELPAEFENYDIYGGE